MKTKEMEKVASEKYDILGHNVESFFHWSDKDIWCDGYVTAMDEYASQFQQEWIPVEVRLPEENIPVLCTNVNGVEDVELLTIGLRYKDSTSFYITEINQPTDQVTHWMPFPPLPQPYNPTKS